MKFEYTDGRYFVSPIIGCSGKCIYCYLNTKLSDSNIRKNSLKLEVIREKISSHPCYIPGKHGSIISIGAWGDLFPKNNIKLTAHSVDWIKGLLSLGNPVQIMSKFYVEKDVVDEICSSIAYENQLLYSTTITTFNKWSVIEPHTASPEERLITTSFFKKNLVKTNVMIKPFLPRITDKEVDLFRMYFNKYKPDYCVVGILYCDDRIKANLISSMEDLRSISGFLDTNQVLDCTGSLKMNAISTSHLDMFIYDIKKIGIAVFKKSSCVTSNLLGIKNIANYKDNDPASFCVRCGNC